MCIPIQVFSENNLCFSKISLYIETQSGTENASCEKTFKKIFINKERFFMLMRVGAFNSIKVSGVLELCFSLYGAETRFPYAYILPVHKHPYAAVKAYIPPGI
jgi:hypothetical protein